MKSIKYGKRKLKRRGKEFPKNKENKKKRKVRKREEAVLPDIFI